jgi:hypothetical protein
MHDRRPNELLAMRAVFDNRRAALWAELGRFLFWVETMIAFRIRAEGIFNGHRQYCSTTIKANFCKDRAVELRSIVNYYRNTTGGS